MPPHLPVPLHGTGLFLGRSRHRWFSSPCSCPSPAMTDRTASRPHCLVLHGSMGSSDQAGDRTRSPTRGAVIVTPLLSPGSRTVRGRHGFNAYPIHGVAHVESHVAIEAAVFE